MGEDTSAIREQIADTRTELGDTVAQLAEKADVKTRTKERAAELKDDARQRAQDVVDKARGAVPGSPQEAAEQVTDAGRRVRDTAAAQPKRTGLLVALAVVIGLLVLWRARS